MRVYLAGTYGLGGGQWLGGLLREDIPRRGGSRPWVLDRGGFEAISGGSDIYATDDPEYPRGGFDETLVSKVNMLESFYYIQPWQTAIIHKLKSFMLDSGAYTFAYNPKNVGVELDWGDYLERYAQYVRDNGVELFFELDIDPIVGYEEVRRMRDKLEVLTSKRCIPVWHLERGLEDFYETCSEYPYVAIGGIADKGRTSLEKYLPALIREAHRRGAKVHGLGYTNLAKLKHLPFDSVDSTAWLYGNRGGFLYRWDGSSMSKEERREGKRLSAREAARHNFIEWVRMGEQLDAV